MTAREMDRLAERWERRWNGASPDHPRYRTAAELESEACLRRIREQSLPGCLLCQLEEME